MANISQQVAKSWVVIYAHAWMELYQPNQVSQYKGIFKSLVVIALFSKDPYSVSLWMNNERGLAEDFSKL